MLRFVKSLAVSAALLVGSVFSAQAITVTDPVLYSDLDTGSSIALGDLVTSGPIVGPSTLSIRYGLWTGPAATVSLSFTFNGTVLAPPPVFSTAYFTTPSDITYDVTGLTIDGANTLSVFGTTLSGGPTTYAVGEITLEYNTEVVPLPATLPLLAGGMLVGGAVLRRRNRKAA